MSCWKCWGSRLHSQEVGYRLPGGSGGKESACNAGDPGSIPGSGRSPEEWQSSCVFLPGESHGEEPGGLQSTGLQVGHN